MLSFVRRPAVAGAAAALLATIAATGPAAAAGSTSTPFKFTFDERSTPITCPRGLDPATYFCVQGSGVPAPGSEQKPFQPALETYGSVVDMAHPDAKGCIPDGSIASISDTDKPADQIFVVTVGTFCPTGNMVGIDTGTFKITGGSGAYKNARGGGTFVTEAKGMDLTTGQVISTTSYSGTVTR
jgi:hypothetical protein